MLTTVDVVSEDLVEPLVLQATLEEFVPSGEDGRAVDDMPCKRARCAQIFGYSGIENTCYG